MHRGRYIGPLIGKRLKQDLKCFEGDSPFRSGLIRTVYLTLFQHGEGVSNEGGGNPNGHRRVQEWHRLYPYT